MPTPAPMAAREAAEERRIDLTDGCAYTRAEFIEEYGGTREWELGKPAAAHAGCNNGLSDAEAFEMALQLSAQQAVG